MNKEVVSLSVVYKNLFGRIKELIVNPKKEWELIFAERKSTNDVLAQFTLPLLGLYTTIVFVGYLFSHQELNFEAALKEAVFTFSSHFFGLYVCYYLLVKVLNAFKLGVDKTIIFQLAAYSSGVVYITGSLTAMVSETIVIGSIINFYLVYLLWLAFGVITQVAKEQRVWVTVMSGIMLLVTPMLIYRLFVYISNLTL
ncbi:YIP1 family protein [Carboxylicivirga marina]|uniref:YIP1 family protein n=1 Tax=Carboxylicivirga marina TaxID=2800988 RepID=UPI002597EBFA|nr:YIP1 family protein [uncultured Carboxylicivirga sp.]